MYITLSIGKMSDTPEKVNKTKVLLALKTEVTNVRQELDAEKSKVDKLQKRLAQVGPALDDILFPTILSSLLGKYCALQSSVLSHIIFFLLSSLIGAHP